MIGVAIGLGNFWRFPYLVGRFGGAAFVAVYLVLVVIIGVPGLMAEWTLGRHTGRGTVGAFERAGFPGGRFVGWFMSFMMMASAAYYANAVGWVLAFAGSNLLRTVGLAGYDASRALPPDSGFVPGAFLTQATCTILVLGFCIFVLLRGLRAGIENASRWLIPALFVILLVLIARGLMLPGAFDGVRWYLLKFRPSDITGSVMVAALGQLVFSIGLGGTFMVTYGSYLSRSENLGRSAILTAGADTAAGLLAGLAIFPAVFALGLEPGSGPGLIFDTLPRIFDAVPAGHIFAALFFLALLSAALLSEIAAMEVMIAGLTDNTRLTRRNATILTAILVLALAVPPMVNMRVFVPWDLTFGSGMQTLGALFAVLTVGWAMKRAAVLEEMGAHGTPAPRWLILWIRFVVPGCILTVGIMWLLTDVLGRVRGV
jgi:neurotransmitter:Na+ symporter, NSS family